eukprot:8875948-Pyramimonas_sp.AAC.1
MDIGSLTASLPLSGEPLTRLGQNGWARTWHGNRPSGLDDTCVLTPLWYTSALRDRRKLRTDLRRTRYLLEFDTPIDKGCIRLSL